MDQDLRMAPYPCSPSEGYLWMLRHDALPEAKLRGTVEEWVHRDVPGNDPVTVAVRVRVVESGVSEFAPGDEVMVAVTYPADCNRLPKDYELGLPDVEAVPVGSEITFLNVESADEGWVFASSLDEAAIVRPSSVPRP
jgi:hypothetical protein